MCKRRGGENEFRRFAVASRRFSVTFDEVRRAARGCRYDVAPCRCRGGIGAVRAPAIRR
ncbi:hypothetical protein BURPS668_A2147 [Burkholderia pseudomallei 668]|nr:hypothetical protein BURPS668_A2147 [Burkholderia pseudomallei 668]